MKKRILALFLVFTALFGCLSVFTSCKIKTAESLVSKLGELPELTKGYFGTEYSDVSIDLAPYVDKKGNNVKVIEVGDKTIIADYFVLATGNTNTHVRALADEVEFKIGERGVDPLRHEGKEGHSSWRVLDYASVLVHVFDREAREFYKLDKLYTDFE